VERLHALGEAYIKFAFENDAYFRVIFSIQPRSEAGLEEVPEGGGYNILREAVSQAVDSGEIRGVEDLGKEPGSFGASREEHIDAVSMFLWSLTHGLVTLSMSNLRDPRACTCGPDPVQLLRSFAPFVNCGIRMPGACAGRNENSEDQCESE